jgi:hypothetical protein
MAKFLCRNLITDLYPTIVHKFLMDYLWGGEGRSRAKRAVEGVGEAHGRGVGEAVKVDGVLWDQRWQRALGEAVEVDSVLQGRRQWRAPGKAIEVEGEAVEATACSEGEAVEGALRRRWRH